MMTDDTQDTQESVLARARALLQERQASEAAQLLESHLRRNTGTAEEHMLLGIALHQAGQGLAGLQALEQAIELEPGNAAAHLNLGHVYKEFGRHHQALAEYERALQLRPNYAPASRAVEEMRQHLARTAAPPPIIHTSGPSFPNVPLVDPGLELIDTRPVGRRLWEAINMLMTSPGRAMNGGLDSFFNTPGAVGAVIALFMLGISLQVVVQLLAPETAAGEAGGPAAARGGGYILGLVLGPIVGILVSAAVIATFNQLTGTSDEFGSDFGSLALAFTLIHGTTTLTVMSASLLFLLVLLVGAPPALAGIFGFTILLAGLWALVLQVWLVHVATDLNILLAWFLLGAASFGARVVVGVLFAGL